MYQLLDKIDSPADLRKLNVEELPQLCSEIRSYMVDCCSRNPGHLASSLGTVEMIVASHYVFETPDDKLVFDVGHQAYAHKIITGRREAFQGNRTKDGISGFPNRDESQYDSFGTGHSSTSISAALGLAEAAKMQGQHHKVVAMIGDGALTGGLALEGINNAGASKADLLVLLNDNNQSIDQNKGAVHDYLLSLTTSATYNRLKKQVWDSMGESKARKRLQRFVVSAKSLAVKRSGGDLFEALGFRYFGPVNGNDVVQIIDALRRLKALDGPRVLHCFTVKGKGYAPAEQDPATWHAPGRFNPETGERIRNTHPADRYQDVFGQTLLELARKDSRVVGITPAMAKGCGMCILAKEMPERFFDVGIEEEHAVTFSAGLAAGGMKPFCNIYSAFSQRAYDQIIHDVALQHLPVVLCFDRAGLVGRSHPPGRLRYERLPQHPRHRDSRPRRRVGTPPRNVHRMAAGQRTFHYTLPTRDGTGRGVEDGPAGHPPRRQRPAPCRGLRHSNPGHRPHGLYGKGSRRPDPGAGRQSLFSLQYALPQTA